MKNQLAFANASLNARVLLFALACGLSACGSIHFDVAQDLPEQQVPGSPIANVLPSFLPSPAPLKVDLQAATKKMGTGPATRAEVKSLTLQITPHGTSGNFDFIEEVHIYIQPNDANSTLPKVEIATLKPVPRGQYMVAFTIVPNVDILPYVNSGALISAQATGNSPPMTVTYDGHIVITVFV